MDRRSLLKSLATLPFLGWVAPKAHATIEAAPAIGEVNSAGKTYADAIVIQGHYIDADGFKAATYIYHSDGHTERVCDTQDDFCQSPSALVMPLHHD